MADPEGKKPEQRPDATRAGGARGDFAARAVPDPANPQPLTRLTGYRGQSSEAGSVRLYLDANISSYVDIPEGDIAFELPVPHETEPLGAVTLWIKQDSNLKFQSTSQQGGQSMYGQYGY